MYLLREAPPRLVLLKFAAGSDVSVVVKHEVKFVLGISNISFWLSTQLCFINYLFINRHKARNLLSNALDYSPQCSAQLNRIYSVCICNYGVPPQYLLVGIRE